MHVYHLQKAANTEVESSLLRCISLMNIEYSVWILVDKQWCVWCYLLSCQLGSVGARDWIPCKTVTDFCKVSLLSPMWCFLCCSINRVQPFVRERNWTQMWGQISQDSLWAGRTEDSCTTQREHEVENSVLDLLLLKWQQEEVLFFLSLMWHKCTIGNWEFCV